MLPYYLLATLAVALAGISSSLFPWRRTSLAKRLIDPFFVATLLVLAIFSGTRIGIGRDYYLYTAIYNRIDTSTSWITAISSSPQEAGFTLFSLIIRAIGFDERGFILILSSVTVAVIAIAMHLARVPIAYGILTYILFAHYLSPFNIARQGLACAIILLAAILITKPRRKLAAIILALFSITIHVSALFAIIALVCVYFVKITVRSMLIVTAATWVVGASVTQIPIIRNILASLNPRYLDYILSQETGGFGTYLVAAVHLVIAIYLAQRPIWNQSQRWWLSAYMLTPAFYILGTNIAWAARLGEYSSILMILLLPYALRREPRVGIRLAIITIGIGYYTAYLLNYGGLLPYESWVRL